MYPSTAKLKLPDNLAAASWTSLAVYFVAHVAFAAVERSLSVGAHDTALICPAAGLLATALILTPRKRWPFLAAAAMVAEFVVSLVLEQQAFHVAYLIPAIAIPAEAIAFAFILTVFLPQPWFRRPGFEVFAYIMIAAMIAPLIGALISSQYLAVTGASVREALGAFGAWWASDLLGIALVVPAILGTMLEISVPGANTRRGYATIAAMALVWLGAITLLLGLPAQTAGATAHAEAANGIIAVLVFSVAAVIWLALKATPGAMAVTSLLVALLLSLFASAPGSRLGAYVSLDPFLLQVLYVLLITSSAASFLISLGRFEQVHQLALSQLRRSSARLVAQIATRLSQCSPEDHREAIAWSLGRVGRSCGADRCLMIEIDPNTDTFRVTQRWLRDGVSDSSARFRDTPLSSVMRPFESILEGGSLFVIRDTLPHDHPQRRLLELADARSAGYATIRGDDQVLGVLILSWLSSRRRWSNETSILLQSAAQMIGSTISRIRAMRVESDYREKLRELTAELARLDDQIRRETAADLHDGAAQSLAIARMRVAQLRRNPAPAPSDLYALEDMIVTALSQIRGVIRNMAPASPFDFGIRYALREFVEQTNEQLDLRLSLRESGDLDGITGDAASLLYRATRELVTNAIKHADPDHVHIELACNDAQVVLRVSDDGSGLGAADGDASTANGSGLGLFGLRERLRRFDGSIETSSDESGTRVKLTLSTDDRAAELAVQGTEPT